MVTSQLVARISVKCLSILNQSIDQRQNCASSYHTRARCVFLCTNITQISSITIMTNIQDDGSDDNNDHDVCLLFFYSKKRFEYFDLLNHCTSNDQHWAVGGSWVIAAESEALKGEEGEHNPTSDLSKKIFNNISMEIFKKNSGQINENFHGNIQEFFRKIFKKT